MITMISAKFNNIHIYYIYICIRKRTQNVLIIQIESAWNFPCVKNHNRYWLRIDLWSFCFANQFTNWKIDSKSIVGKYLHCDKEKFALSSKIAWIYDAYIYIQNNIYIVYPKQNDKGTTYTILFPLKCLTLI